MDTAPQDHQHRISALSVLLDVALKLSGEHEEDRILQIVADGACAAIPCERASLFLLDEQRQELYTRTVTELELQEIRIPRERGVIGWVAREQRVTCVDDPFHDARWDSSIDRRTGFVTRNLLAVPVLAPADQRLLGVFQLINSRCPRFEEFDTQIAQAFAAHAATALERSRLRREASRAAELRREIELARRIQKGFLPQRMPRVPGYEVATWWRPAESVSGDYYDWFPLPDQRLGLAVGDVCGHGLGPALIMASLRAMLHVLARTTSSPEMMLKLLSETISQDLQQTQFVTFLIAAWEPATHTVRFANAGHGPALRIDRRHGVVQRLEATRLPFGFPELPEKSPADTIRLSPGDVLLLGTDGIVEARNAGGELFGVQRLIDLTLTDPRRSAAELAMTISDAVTAFQACSQPADDATLLVVERQS